MGCAGSLELDLDEMKLAYASGWSYLSAAFTNNQLALADWNIPDDHAAIKHLIDAVANLIATGRMLIYYYAPFTPEYMLIHIIETHLAGTTFDMDTLLSTMLGANFEQLQKFVGIYEAYKVAMWNAPFNAELYSALARGFEQWPQG